MKRVSVDIGGTFTDCFLVWDGEYVEAKALTTHHNLALGFNQALQNAYETINLDLETVMAEVDSVRYATTLGTNALIERKGPRVGLLITAGFESSVPLSRARGYGDGLPERLQADLPMAKRPDPLVPIPLIAGIRERIDTNGNVLMTIDPDDVRHQVRALVDQGVQAFVVSLVNSISNPSHELLVEEIIREEYPSHMLGAMPVILSHLVSGRKGEYVRTSSAIMDAFLHQVMYHGLSSLELNLRETGHKRPMLVIHNSGGMAQLNSTDALQTIHSGPVAGIHASEHLAAEADLGNVICTDMGGTSFDIGLVVSGGVKFYDFNPVIERWMVSVPMVHLLTLGAGGGSIAWYDRMHHTVQAGPESAGSDPGPACYDKGGLLPTVTDADLLLGYLDPDNYAGGTIKLNPKRSKFAMDEALCEPLDISVTEAALLTRQKVDNNMANGIFQELRTRGYEPRQFTMLAYGGNGGLHCCGIAEVLGIDRVFVPPFSSVFSAVGAGNMHQLHIHEKSLYLTIYDSTTRALFDDFDRLNAIVGELEEAGKKDLLRQGMKPSQIQRRLEMDMRYGNQLAQTAVVSENNRITSRKDLLRLIGVFARDYGKRFGEGSQAPEAGIRVNTLRVASYVELDTVQFEHMQPPKGSGNPVEKSGDIRKCWFVGHKQALDTAFYNTKDMKPDDAVLAPAVVVSPSSTFLVQPGWRLIMSEQGAGWLVREQSR
ncbi:MAG: hydantoinase/oxoprolinase family protein [Rhodospirillales bacterium]|nr:hydantoinase/oxoprolinase family protein [Rhodospirillales bacterium]